ARTRPAPRTTSCAPSGPGPKRATQYVSVGSRHSGRPSPADILEVTMSEWSLICHQRRDTMDAMRTIRDTEQKPLGTGFGPTTTPREVAAGVNLDGKTAVVTGGSSGIGAETVRVLAEAGARVIVGARDVGKADRALAGLSDVEAWPLDLADPDSIDRF